MASKRAGNSGGVRSAFASGGPVRSRRPAEPDDDEPQPPRSDPAGLTGEPVERCGLCAGHWTTAGRFEHDSACAAAGRTVMARRLAELRRNGLA